MNIKFEYTQKIEEEIHKAIIKKVKERVLANEQMIKDHISFISRNVFKGTDEYFSLTSGELMKHFGLYNNKAKSIVDEIIDALSKEIVLDFEDDFFCIYSVKSNFEDVLKMNVSSYVSSSKRGSFEIPWLQWFLLEGDRILVDGFHIQLGAYSPKQSRSEGAIMVPGGTWKKPVNAKYSGVINDNWITHAISSFSKVYQREIKYILKKVLNV